jgi:hypothetical protein
VQAVVWDSDHDSLEEEEEGQKDEEEQQQEEEEFLSDASSVYEDRVAEVWQGSVQAFLNPTSQKGRGDASSKRAAPFPTDTPVPFGEQMPTTQARLPFAVYPHCHQRNGQGEEVGVPSITPSAVDVEAWKRHRQLEKSDGVRDRKEEKALLLSMLGDQAGDKEEVAPAPKEQEGAAGQA